MKAALDEDAFLSRRRGTRLCKQAVQRVEISLCHVTSAQAIRVLDGDRDDTALFVVGDRRPAGELFGRGESITRVIDLLQMELINQMATNCSALQQVLIECGGRVTGQ